MSNDVSSLYYSIDPANLPQDRLKGVAGHIKVNAQYDHFVAQWSNGIWKIREQLDQLAQRLSAAGLAYTQTEREVVKAEHAIHDAIAHGGSGGDQGTASGPLQVPSDGLQGSSSVPLQGSSAAVQGGGAS